jgi:uncharacterized protein YecT (DUF1311 family)
MMTVLALFFIRCQDPPTASLARARQALEQATEAGSLRYAKETYHTAESLMKAGWMEMGRQNGRLIFFRNYKAADSLLNTAYKTAMEAARETEARVHNMEFLARTDRDNLQKDLLSWREVLNGSLTKLRAEHMWNSAELALKTSDRLMSQEEFEEARSVAAKGNETLRKMASVLTEYDNDEVKKLKIWQRWVQETIAESKSSGTYAIIVDKSRHKLYLVQGGKVVQTYDCELGYNSAHQKLYSGDGATPEGKYHITAVKTNGRSKYYKALLLSYPNETDYKRFNDAKIRGVILPRARIGGLIEIHGDGGKNRDWTEGCVALTNKDMDRIMQYVTVGTPVTIVRRSDRWP